MIYSYSYVYGSVVLNNESKTALQRFVEKYFVAFWDHVEGDEFIDIINGNNIALSIAPGTEFVPGAYAGTLTAPNIAALKTHDTANVLYDGSGVPIVKSANDFYDADLENVPVDYNNTSPYDINKIGLIDTNLVLTNEDKKYISDFMNLWVYYWGVWYDAGTLGKTNRGM